MNFTEQTPHTQRLTQELQDRLMTPQGAFLALCVAAMAYGSINGKKKLTTGGIGGDDVLRRAAKLGRASVGSDLMGDRSLWIGGMHSDSALWFPYMCPGGLLVGAPNTGKSYSGFEPLLYSAILQNLGILLYDYKYPDQTARLAPLAKALGYKVRVVAPGTEETGCINLIDLIKSATDTIGAENLIKLAKKNLKIGGSNSSAGDYFNQASTKILSGLFCLVKTCPFPDLLMVQAILSLDNLPRRLWDNRGDKIPEALYVKIKDLVTAGSAEEQLAGLITSCDELLGILADLNFASALCGKTNVPLDIKDGEMVILGLPREYLNVMAPVLGVIANFLVDRNILERRKNPLVFSADELHTIYLEGLVSWLAQGRSYGFLGLLGIQSPYQLVDRYGENNTRTIYSSLPTKWFFNPNDQKTAGEIMEWTGTINQSYRTKGDSSGKKKTISHSEHQRFITALEKHDITRFRQGEALMISPGYIKGKQAFIPVRKRISPDQSVVDDLDGAEQLWKATLEPALKNLNKGRKKFTEEDLGVRRVYAEKWLMIKG